MLFHGGREPVTDFNVDEPHCASARGGIFHPEQSESWDSIGIRQLGLSYLGYGGNGDYGQDKVCEWSPITDIIFDMTDVLISTINETDHFIGQFGLGFTQSNFGDRVVGSALTQAVKDFGWIPSYSYGYTAGAHYRMRLLMSVRPEC